MRSFNLSLSQSWVEWFSIQDFMPHGHCYLWQPVLLWTHFSSDMIIGISYLLISLALYRLVRDIRLPFSTMFLAFGAFIGFCGLTHFMEVWTLWTPDYWWSGLVKVITAAASLATALYLIPLKPKILHLVKDAQLSSKRKSQLEEANKELHHLNATLKEIGELRSQFVANISHELRTPLTLIMGGLESIKKNSSLGLKEQSQLEIALSNTQILHKHVQDLLDVAKMEAGHMIPQWKKFDMSHLTRITLAYFESLMQSRGIQVKLEIPPSLEVVGDSEKIQRILINLFSNAYKFTPNQGQIQCTLSLSEENEGELFLRVDDNGPGIPPQQRQIIFERFKQADGSLTRKVGGTGLGLSIVQELVKLHHGRVEVGESPLSGASFKVFLPLRPPKWGEMEEDIEGEPDHLSTNEMLLRGTLEQLEGEQQSRLTVEKETAFDSAQELGGMERAKVLVCEDNADLSRHLKEVLQEDYQVITAANGQEGLKILDEIQPDLLITDIMMPEMSGEQMVRVLRQDLGHSELTLPILLLSAKADEETKVQLLAEGAQDFVTKPLGNKSLK